MLSSFENFQFRPFETGFPPWDDREPSVFLRDEEPAVFNPRPSHEPVCPNSGSYNTNPPPNLGPNRKDSETLTSGSAADERKRRRMMSNRESARRSRMRKQNHVDNLTKQLNRLRIGNRELMNRLMLAVHQNRLIRWENERLQSEAAALRQRLRDLRQVLIVRQHLNQPSAWPCNDVTSISGQSPHYSLIT